jgi:hypothetical protein
MENKLIMVLAVSALVLSIVALAIGLKINATNFLRSKTETRYYAVSPADFIALWGNINNNLSGGYWGYIANFGPSGEGQYYSAPVNLPQGAVVTNLRLYYREPNENSIIRLKLIKADPLKIPLYSTTMATLEAPRSSTLTLIETSNITEPIIYNNGYTYALEAYIQDTTIVGVTTYSASISGVCITYTVTEPYP